MCVCGGGGGRVCICVYWRVFAFLCIRVVLCVYIRVCGCVRACVYVSVFVCVCVRVCVSVCLNAGEGWRVYVYNRQITLFDDGNFRRYKININ